MTAIYFREIEIVETIGKLCYIMSCYFEPGIVSHHVLNLQSKVSMEELGQQEELVNVEEDDDQSEPEKFSWRTLWKFSGPGMLMSVRNTTIDVAFA
jgi:hypothetical protein